eukprot:255736_1
MMKLFLLSTLLFVGIHGTKVTTTSCTASTTCSGDSCTTTTNDLPSGCQKIPSMTASATYECSGGWYNVTTYSTSDVCSGENTELGYPTGECIVLLSTQSGKFECGSAFSVNLFYVGIMVLIASLLQ